MSTTKVDDEDWSDACKEWGIIATEGDWRKVEKIYGQMFDDMLYEILTENVQ